MASTTRTGRSRAAMMVTGIGCAILILTAVAQAAPNLNASELLVTSTILFNADADARVDETNPTTNYGTGSTLRVDGASDPDVESYLRFTVSNISGAIQSVKLRVFDTDGSSNGPAIYTTSTSWSETGITWNNRPARTSSAIDNKGAIATNTWVEYNVTPVVVGAGVYSFVLAADSTDGVTFSSREGSAPPQLVLTLASGATSTPTTRPTNTPAPTVAPPSPTPGSSGDPVLVGAGNISSCGNDGDAATAKLLDTIGGTVVTLGDNAYESGTAAEFANCFDPTWGRNKARIHPAVGNHEYVTTGAAGYYSYFGAAAGDATKGYYSYNLGAWHIIALNSNCAQVGGCNSGSAQERWLRADLAAHPAACTLAYWHHPRFSSGEHGSTTSMQPIWQALYDANADLVLSGHDHHYERFAPQDPTGKADPARGMRQFIVGTGGKSHYVTRTALVNSEVRNSDTFGVLKLTLHANGYNWTFVPEAGKSFSDSGSSACH